jgi:hypothetical protein
MSPMDVPGRSKPLADSGDDRRAGIPRQPYPDGGAARSPAELLDQLRLRLSQLPENHPSAPVEKSDGGPGSRPERHDRPEQADRSDRPELPDRPEQPELSEQPGKTDQAVASEPDADASDPEPDASEPDASELEPGGAAEEPTTPAKTGGEADGSPGGGLLDWLRDLDAAGSLPDLAGWGDGELNLSWPGHPETYRPWFMAGEPSKPWFATDSDL